ncbi:MAG: hypothetical protein ABL908_07080 [Hyphomicrobium sp.]
MNLGEHSTPIAARPRSISPYVLAWGALALLAAFYLTALTLRPDLVTEHLPIFRPDSLDGKSGEPEGNQGQRAMSKAFAEVQGLRQSVSQMQLELAKLKTELDSSQVHDRTLASRIALLEEKVAAAAPTLASAATAKAAAAAEARQPEPKQPDKAAPKVASAVPPARLDTARLETGSIGARPTTSPLPAQLPAQLPAMASSALAGSEAAAVVTPNVINAPHRSKLPVAVAQAGVAPGVAVGAAAVAATATAAATRPAPVAGLTTDSETATLTSFGPATVTTAKPEPTGPIGLRISNGPSLDSLRLSWSLLADRHSAQFRNMEARYAARVPEGDGDPSFDLIAGPVKTPAEARRICKALAAKNIPCQIGSFAGPSL